MSRSLPFLLAAVALVAVSLAPVAAEKAGSADGLQPGDPIGAFYVTKVAGAVDDAVEPGESLCYRCRYGSRPMVMVFARQTGGQVPELLQALDRAVGEHEEAKLKGLLTLLGQDAGELTDQAEKIAAKASAKLVPVVVAKETKTGPQSYKISPTSEVTVILAKDSQVVSQHTYRADEIDIESIMASTRAMLEG